MCQFNVVSTTINKTVQLKLENCSMFAKFPNICVSPQKELLSPKEFMGVAPKWHLYLSYHHMELASEVLQTCIIRG